MNIITVHISNFNGQRCELLFSSNTNGKEIRHGLQRYFPLKADEMVLIFNGKILGDNKTLQQIGVRNGDELQLIRKTKKQEQQYSKGYHEQFPDGKGRRTRLQNEHTHLANEHNNTLLDSELFFLNQRTDTTMRSVGLEMISRTDQILNNTDLTFDGHQFLMKQFAEDSTPFAEDFGTDGFELGIFDEDQEIQQDDSQSDADQSDNDIEEISNNQRQTKDDQVDQELYEARRVAKEISTYHRYNYQIRNSDPRVFHKKSDYENSHVDKRGKIKPAIKFQSPKKTYEFTSNATFKRIVKKI
ncbi:MAG: hypothetical protein EZS28_008121 [Streblomastix strix]|uniref:Ubiquitin-like domain-containing protein n=1 Tax=Streblomastix strix TaxID=222440 RepID=A0A5J4WN02_9EUKA|nr:MAG: hypothetical protein EZS28_008121 [Streblomastix strix]